MDILCLSRNELDIALNNNAVDFDNTFIFSFYDPRNETLSHEIDSEYIKLFKVVDYDNDRKFHYGEEASEIIISYYNDNIHKFFSRKDAKEIINEVKLLPMKINKLIVQCETGKTLSAAVSGALDIYLNSNYNSRFLNDIFYKDFYNVTIYNTILSTFKNDKKQ